MAKATVLPAKAEGELAVPKKGSDLVAFALNPDQVLDIASDLANRLKKMIIDLKLYSNIKGKNYAHVEAWTTMGSMLGIVAMEEESKKLDPNTWETIVVLKRLSDGAVIGRASHVCSRSERSKKTWEEYAIKSMSATRATGKAFRLSYSWIMNLAGYEPCPKEEMDQVVDAEEAPFENGNTPKPTPPKPTVDDIPEPAQKDIYRDDNVCKIQLARIFKRADLWNQGAVALFAEWLQGKTFAVASDFIYLMKTHKLLASDMPVVVNEIKELEVAQIEEFIIGYKESKNA